MNNDLISREALRKDFEERRRQTMITNEEARKAIEKYQKEHPLPFRTMLDVTAISSKEGADLISQTIEKISKQMEEDREFWCICEMAKMYMQGVRPVYHVRPHGEWEQVSSHTVHCSCCNKNSPDMSTYIKMNYCPNCGTKMIEEAKNE